MVDHVINVTHRFGNYFNTFYQTICNGIQQFADNLLSNTCLDLWKVILGLTVNESKRLVKCEGYYLNGVDIWFKVFLGVLLACQAYLLLIIPALVNHKVVWPTDVAASQNFTVVLQ